MKNIWQLNVLGKLRISFVIVILQWTLGAHMESDHLTLFFSVSTGVVKHIDDLSEDQITR